MIATYLPPLNTVPFAEPYVEKRTAMGNITAAPPNTRSPHV